MDPSSLGLNDKDKNSRPKTCNSDHLFPQLPTIYHNKPPHFSSSSARSPSKSSRVRSSLTAQHSLRSSLSAQRSQQSIRSSLSNSTSSSAGSASSGGSGLEKQHRGTNLDNSDLTRSIDSETLAIAIELSKLKARREKDQQETFARIMDINEDGDLKSHLLTPIVSARGYVKSASPSTAYRGPGAHFLNWHIPKHIAGSRALQRVKSESRGTKNRFLCSPLHKPDKQEWMTKLVDPHASGLRIPTARPPPVLDYPCSWDNNLRDTFNRHNLKLYTKEQDQCPPFPPSQSTPVQKSLVLSNTKRNEQEGLKLAGSMFTKSQGPPMSWFIVHPDWRNEPRIRRTWGDLEGEDELEEGKEEH